MNACTACSSGAGVTCFCFFFCGSAGAFLPVRFGGRGSMDFGRISKLFLSLEMRADLRRFCVSDDSGSTTAIDFLRRVGAFTGAGSGDERSTSLRRVGLAAFSSGMLSCNGAACAFVDFRVVRREKVKPSSFSSYATLVVVFFVVVVAFLLVPFNSALTLFGAGASSSSKARFALCRRVLGRFAAIGRDVSGERAKMVDIESVVVKVDSVLLRGSSVKAHA